MNESGPHTSKPWNKAVVLELVLLALVMWLAHYFFFRSLGLYEDDYSHIAPPLGWHLSELLGAAVETFVNWDLGRPLGFFLADVVAFLGGKLGGLSAIYIIAYLVQTTNAVLFYFLLKRIGQDRLAFLGALVFGLFPADTTHTFLMHSLGLHTSLTLLLLASHSYLSGRRALAYAVSLGCLLIYESPYMVFLAIPLLGQPWDRKLVREMIRHVAVWLGILLVVVVVRAMVGEGRVQALGSTLRNTLDVSRQILAALAIGPAVSLSMFWQGPAWTLSHWNRELTFVFVGCLPVLVWMLSRLRAGFVAHDPAASLVIPLELPGRQTSLRLTIPNPQTVKLLLTAVIMLSLAYGFSFTHFPPSATYGRLTSVHLAAAFGGALLFACLAALFLGYAQSHRLGYGAIVILAAYLALVITYRFSIQQDFKKAWQNERAFWANAIAQFPDMADGTIILVSSQGLPTTHFIQTNSWADPIMLEQIFQFPSAWETPPRLFVVSPNWTKSVVREGDQLLWSVPAATWDAHWEALPDSNVVVLTMENGTLVRQFGTIKMHRLTLNLKPLSPNAPPALVHGALYPLLISPTQ